MLNDVDGFYFHFGHAHEQCDRFGIAEVVILD